MDNRLCWVDDVRGGKVEMERVWELDLVFKK